MTSNTSNKTKKSAIKIVALILIAAILLSAVGTGVYFLFFKDTLPNDPGNTPSENLTSQFGTIVGKFTDREIKDEKSAILAVQDVADNLGFKNATEELTTKSTNTVDNLTYYRLQQNYQGVPVYGSTFVVVSDENGEAKGLTGNAADIDADISLTPTVTQEQVEASILSYVGEDVEISVPELSDDMLVIYNYDDVERATLAYEINISTVTYILNAQNAEILATSQHIQTAMVEATSDGNNETFDVSFDGIEYCLYDEQRNITVYSLQNMDSGTFDWLNPNIWTSFKKITSNDNIFNNQITEKNLEYDKAVRLYLNVISVYDYYERLDKDFSLPSVYLYYNDLCKSGKNALGGTVPLADGTSKSAVFMGSVTGVDKIDVIAHEFTHCVSGNIVDWASVESDMDDVPGAINEGYSDIFGVIIESKVKGLQTIDWIFWNDSEYERNLQNPSITNFPKNISDSNNSGQDYSHGYSTVVSHAAYLMTQDTTGGKPLTTAELAELWYHALYLLPSNCSFFDLRGAIEMTAAIRGFSADQITCISAAFDAVGIAVIGTFNTFSIDVSDFLDKPYSYYSISIDGEGSNDQLIFAHSPVTEIKNLSDGRYTITIMDEAYLLNNVELQIDVDSKNVKLNKSISVKLPGGHTRAENLLVDYIADLPAPNEQANTQPYGFIAYMDVSLRGNLIYSSSGQTTDGQKWTKFYFEEEDTYIISLDDMDTQTNDLELYIMFAKAGNSVLGGQHDEIYRKVTISKTRKGYKLGTSTGSLATLIDNATKSYAYYCKVKSESMPNNFLYFDASKQQVLTTDEWKNEIHFNDRFFLNNDNSLPKSAADAVKEGFIKLPVGDTKYHQLFEDKFKNWYEIFESEFQQYACLKYCHPDGREAIYLIVEAGHTQESIENDYNATKLITLKERPSVGPTYNYSPNDFSDNGFLNLLSKGTVASIAHYYFDMLPYYWWGNAPDDYGHIHTFGDWVVTKEATETANGEKTRACSSCGEKETEEIPLLNHTHTYITASRDATCTEAGWEKQVCYCGDVKDEKELPIIDHNYVDGKCSMCGKQEPQSNLIPGDALEYNGHYYKVYLNSDMGWHEAKKWCEEQDGYLATITSAEENAFIRKLIKNASPDSYGFWIGGTDEYCEGVWSWVTDEEWEYDNGSYNNARGLQHYLTTFGYGADQWDDQSEKNIEGHYDLCTTIGYVCEWGAPLVPQCPTTEITTQNNLYVSQNINLSLTWKAPSLPKGNARYWVAIMKAGQETETYTDVTQEWITDTSYVISNEFLKNAGTYIITVYAKANGYTQSQSSINVTVSAEPVSNIPESSLYYNEHYYYAFNINEIQSWTDAQKYCESVGGHLVVISSAEENRLVFEQMKLQGYYSAYIGLSDSEAEGEWAWVTGEPVTFTNWHEGEPNSESSREDYAMFYYKYSDGTWNDGDFAGSTLNGGKVFICEWGDKNNEMHVTQKLAYSLNKDKQSYSVIGIGTCTDTEVVISAEYEGLPVTAIGNDAFKGNTGIVSVTIPDSVTSIGTNAFANCESMSSVTLGSGLVTIDYGAFHNCKSLLEITIPASLKTIRDPYYSSDRGVFENCTSLYIITYDGTTESWKNIFVGADWIKNTKVTEVKCTDGNISVV